MGRVGRVTVASLSLVAVWLGILGRAHANMSIQTRTDSNVVSEVRIESNTGGNRGDGDVQTGGSYRSVRIEQSVSGGSEGGSMRVDIETNDNGNVQRESYTRHLGPGERADFTFATMSADVSERVPPGSPSVFNDPSGFFGGENESSSPSSEENVSAENDISSLLVRLQEWFESFFREAARFFSPGS